MNVRIESVEVFGSIDPVLTMQYLERNGWDVLEAV